MLVVSYDNCTGAPELVVFDTLIPQDHPMGFRLFSFPPRYRNRNLRIRVDCDRPLGTITRDEPLIADPAQTILVVELIATEISTDPPVLLVVRMEVLIGRAWPMRTNPCIPWGEGGEGTVAMDIPLDNNGFSIFIQGAYVTVVAYVSGHASECRLHT